MDIFLRQRFYILVGNVSNRGSRFTKHLQFARIAKPPKFIDEIDFDIQKTSLIGTFEVDVRRSRKFASCSTAQPQSDASAVDFKAPEFRDIQVTRNNAVLEESSVHVENMRKKLKIFEAYFMYDDRFVHMLSELQLKSGGFLGHLNVAKYYIDLQMYIEQHIHFISLDVRTMTRYFGKAEVEKILAQKLINRE